MTELNTTNGLNDYNTAIATIGGLKDASVIYKAIETYLDNEDSLKEIEVFK